MPDGLGCIITRTLYFVAIRPLESRFSPTSRLYSYTMFALPKTKQTITLNINIYGNNNQKRDYSSSNR